MHAGLLGPRGRGLPSSASRYVRASVALFVLGLAACGDAAQTRADNSVRTVVGRSGDACTLLPDTSAVRGIAQQDFNDIPVTRLVLPAACPTATVTFIGGPYVERSYKVVVPAGQTLVARALGDSASVAIAIDFPTEPRADRSNVGRVMMDSLAITETREVSVRVRLVPKIREEPPASRVYLTVLARP